MVQLSTPWVESCTIDAVHPLQMTYTTGDLLWMHCTQSVDFTPVKFMLAARGSWRPSTQHAQLL